MTADTPKQPCTPREFSPDADAVAERGTDRQALIQTPKPSKLGAEMLTPEKQKRRFIEAARDAGASEDETDLDAALKRIAKSKAAP